MDRLASRIAVGVLALTTRRGSPGTLFERRGDARRTDAAGRGQGRRPVTSTPSSAPHALATTHSVQPGDTLWSIADDHTADGADWTAIAALNLGRDMADGARFVDPDHIRAGMAAPGSARRRAPGDERRPLREPVVRRPFGDHLPELIALGLGSIACAALARRARRRGSTRSPVSSTSARRCRRKPSTQPRSSTASTGCRRCTPSRWPTASWAGPWATIPPQRRPGRSASPRPASRSGSGSRGPTRPTASSAVRRHGMARCPWRPSRPCRPHPAVPLALPVGDDGEGTWLVALGAGDVLPCSASRPILAPGRPGRGECLGLVRHDPGDRRTGRPRAPVSGGGRCALPCSSSAIPAPCLRTRRTPPSSPPQPSPPATSRSSSTARERRCTPSGRSFGPGSSRPRTDDGSRSSRRRRPIPIRPRSPAVTGGRRDEGRDPGGTADLAPGRRRGTAVDHEPPTGGTPRGPPTEPGPTGRRARRLPRPAPTRRHHR